MTRNMIRSVEGLVPAFMVVCVDTRAVSVVVCTGSVCCSRLVVVKTWLLFRNNFQQQAELQIFIPFMVIS